MLTDLWRQRQALRRAEQRLDLTCQSIIRRFTDGDKDAATAIWTEISRLADPTYKSGPKRRPPRAQDPQLVMVLTPYLDALRPLRASARALEKELEAQAKASTFWTDFASGVRGVGTLTTAGLIGEAGNPISSYTSVKALWKRFGLAVVDGERQRRITDPAQALRHGFNPQRRAFAYNVGASLMRQQRASDPYRIVYDERRTYEDARGVPKAHAHNRAVRHATKAFLRDAWIAEHRMVA